MKGTCYIVAGGSSLGAMQINGPTQMKLLARETFEPLPGSPEERINAIFAKYFQK